MTPEAGRELAERIVTNARAGIGVRLTRDELRALMKTPVGHVVRNLAALSTEGAHG